MSGRVTGSAGSESATAGQGDAVRVLLVAGDSEAAAAVSDELRRAGLETVVHRVAPDAELRESVAGFDPAVVLLDLSSSRLDGGSAFAALRDAAADLPIVVVAESADESVAVDHLQTGAAGYVLTVSLRRLPAAVLAAVEQARLRREARAAEARLAASAERYRLLFENNPLPMWLYDPDSLRILDVNRAAVSHYGYSRERFLEMTLRDLRPPSGFAALDHDVAEARASGGPRRSTGHVHLRSDGTPIEVDVAADDLVVEGLRTRIAVVHDVTAEREAERQLRASEERYRRSFEEGLTADFISTADGRLIACNREFLRVFGFASTEEALASSLTDLYPPEFPRSEYVRLLDERGALERFQLTLLRRDGRRVEVIENVTATYDDDGRIVEIRGYIFDITDHVRLEEQLRESQKMEAVGRLAGGIAHDFNNILAVILSSASFALESLGSTHPAAADIRDVVAAAGRAAHLTDQLLAFGRRSTTRREEVDLNVIVGDAKAVFSRVLGEDIQLELLLSDRPLVAVADGGQLVQVLLNVVLNAREAMPEGGVLRIATEHGSVVDAVEARSLDIKPGRYGIVTVHDSGSGMSPDVLARCFEPFFTTKPDGRGTGLGLAVAFGIARQHGGTMVAASRPGEGASVSLYVPLADRREPSGSHPVASDGSTRPTTVLVCEDEAAVREAMRRILEGAGYHVLEASGPGDALLSLERYRGAVDLLLTDVVMPQMSGHELARRGLALRPELAVLLVSGRTDDGTTVASGHRLLRKPFDRIALLTAVAESLAT